MNVGKPLRRGVSLSYVWFTCAALSLLMALAWGEKASATPLAGEYLWVHDPSRITKCNGKYFVYYTGDRVLMRSSTDLIHWKTGKSVLDRVPA